jgi:peroxiredoxin
MAKYDADLKKKVKNEAPQGVTLLAIDSNVYEDEGDILRTSRKQELNFPVLRDAPNRVADYFDALTTPHVFVLDEGGCLRYRGAIDDITFRNKVATVNYLEQAVDALLQGQEVPRREKASHLAARLTATGKRWHS